MKEAKYSAHKVDGICDTFEKVLRATMFCDVLERLCSYVFYHGFFFAQLRATVFSTVCKMLGQYLQLATIAVFLLVLWCSLGLTSLPCQG